MSLVRKSAIGGAFVIASLVGLSAGALAADMPGNPPPLPLPGRTLTPIDLSTGWYLRGDLAYRFGRGNEAEPAPGFLPQGGQKFGNTIAGGLGAGIKTGWLRTDFTVDIATPMKYEANDGTTSAKISAATFLFNGYLDLGSWYRITPYIGAGVGTARMQIRDYVSTTAPPFTGDSGRTKWNFAWAGMAGLAYAISPNTMVDLGYRYINFGDVTTETDAFGSMTLKQVAAHEVRVGLRWSFDDFPRTR
jgi:opacity protein-like surface antigen